MSITYIVADINRDRPIPDKNTILAFVSIAMSHGGREVGVFEGYCAPYQAPNQMLAPWPVSRPNPWLTARLRIIQAKLEW